MSQLSALRRSLFFNCLEVEPLAGCAPFEVSMHCSADHIGKDKTLNDAIYRIVKKLEISTPGNLRLAQVREGGREVEILDGRLFSFTSSRSCSRQISTFER